jgi:hypothetical protein
VPKSSGWSQHGSCILISAAMQLKLMIQAEARMGGFWRAVGRKWRRRVEAGGAEWVPPTLAAQVCVSGGGDSMKGGASYACRPA